VFNYLLGQSMTLEGISSFSYALNTVNFRGIGDGQFADCDEDAHRDLDGCEYDPAPEKILIPRFLGQSESVRSELLLINLTGGVAFTNLLFFEIFNDNEEMFSAQHAFRCWKRVPLTSISNAFTNSFLANATNDNPNEVLGLPAQESGWIRIDGQLATSSAASITDPAFYAVLVERREGRAVSSLPFEDCTQTNGSLLPTSVFGDD
jgi:hypothetical protein